MSAVRRRRLLSASRLSAVPSVLSQPEVDSISTHPSTQCSPRVRLRDYCDGETRDTGVGVQYTKIVLSAAPSVLSQPEVATELRQPKVGAKWSTKWMGAWIGNLRQPKVGAKRNTKWIGRVERSLAPTPPTRTHTPTVEPAHGRRPLAAPPPVEPTLR